MDKLSGEVTLHEGICVFAKRPCFKNCNMALIKGDKVYCSFKVQAADILNRQ